MFEVEKGVPVPENSGRGPKGKYPFPTMEIGDSFFTEIKTVRAACSHYGIRHDKKFTSRKEGSGFRCWRTA